MYCTIYWGSISKGKGQSVFKNSRSILVFCNYENDMVSEQGSRKSYSLILHSIKALRIERNQSLVKIDRSRICFKKSRHCGSFIVMVAHPWSSNNHQRSIQTWSPGFSRNIGDFFRIFQHLQVGSFLILEIFQFFSTVFIETVQNLGYWVELDYSSSIRSQITVLP